MIEPMYWGKNKGCEFVTGDCSKFYPESVKEKEVDCTFSETRYGTSW